MSAIPSYSKALLNDFDLWVTFVKEERDQYEERDAESARALQAANSTRRNGGAGSSASYGGGKGWYSYEEDTEPEYGEEEEEEEEENRRKRSRTGGSSSGMAGEEGQMRIRGPGSTARTSG